MQQKSFLTFLLSLSAYFLFSKSSLPEGFTDIKTLIPDVEIELRYATTNNFIGQKIEGYDTNRALLSVEAAQGLVEVQNELKYYGLGLKIFDSYRPQRAVNHFVRWAKVLSDTLMKTQYYPNIKKSLLFENQYIATRSGHSRGSSVDVTIIDFNTCKELDMGTPFDFFDSASNLDYKALTTEQIFNRQLLQRVMLKYGFRPYDQEWWHFTLNNEPYPETYFDFSIK